MKKTKTKTAIEYIQDAWNIAFQEGKKERSSYRKELLKRVKELDTYCDENSDEICLSKRDVIKIIKEK